LLLNLQRTIKKFVFQDSKFLLMYISKLDLQQNNRKFLIKRKIKFLIKTSKVVSLNVGKEKINRRTID
jgi:hypothetical protein